MQSPKIIESADRALAVVPQQSLAAPGEYSVEQVRDQINKIQLLMKEALKEGTHFGKIPGTDKETLYKAGAEKICFMFRLAPTYDIRETWDHDHLTVNVQCNLMHIPTGQIVGSGHGMGSTKESKYAYRKAERTCPKCGKATIVKGKAEYGGGWLCFRKKGGCDAKWPDKAPEIESQPTNRVANPDLPDMYNTVVKMACKRAHVAATLTATAASDVFTQDLEEGYVEEHPANPPVQPPPPASPQAVQGAVQEVPEAETEAVYIKRLKWAEKELGSRGDPMVAARWWADMRPSLTKRWGEQSESLAEVRLMVRTHILAIDPNADVSGLQ